MGFQTRLQSESEKYSHEGRAVWRRALFGLVGWTLISSLVGCARDTKIYPDGPSLSEQARPISVDGKNVLPTGFFNQSVNHARVDVALDGSFPASMALRFQTLGGTQAVGGFNGNGDGSRALLGLAAYEGKALSSLGAISFDANSVSGSRGLSVLLIVDLACDGSTIRVVEAEGDESLSSAELQSDGYTRYEVETTAPIWSVHGADIMDPGDPTIMLLHSRQSNSLDSLEDLIAKYPNACLSNTAATSDDLPKSLPTAGLLLALGTPTTLDLNITFVKRISVGQDVFQEWERP